MDSLYFTPNKRPPPSVYPVFYSPDPPRPIYLPPMVYPPPPGYYPAYEPPYTSSSLEMPYKTPIKRKELALGLSYKALNEIEGINDIIYYFKEIISFESELEKCREELARRPDFKIIYLFNHFDRNYSGQILIQEFQLGLEKIGVFSNSDDIYMLIKRFSLDQLEKINVKEFELMFIAKSEANRKEIVRNDISAINYSLDKILKTTKIYIFKLLKLLLDAENALEFVRHKLIEKSVDLTKMFNLIDHSRGGLLNRPEIKGIMSKFGYIVGDDEADMVLMRFDRNRTGQISLKEFIAELNPRLAVLKKK